MFSLIGGRRGGEQNQSHENRMGTPREAEGKGVMEKGI
jgi:hypothetical protein